MSLLRTKGGWRWTAIRLLAIAAGVIVAQIVIAEGEAHVYGPGASLGLQATLDEAAVPHPQHIRVVKVPPHAWCVDALGCTWEDTQTVYVNPDQSILQRQVTFLHEVGHQWDFRQMDNMDRMSIVVALDIVPWWDVMGEVYAEAYAWCGLDRIPKPGQLVAYDFEPTLEAFKATCDAIRRSDD